MRWTVGKPIVLKKMAIPEGSVIELLTPKEMEAFLRDRPVEKLYSIFGEEADAKAALADGDTRGGYLAYGPLAKDKETN